MSRRVGVEVLAAVLLLALAGDFVRVVRATQVAGVCSTPAKRINQGPCPSAAAPAGYQRVRGRVPPGVTTKAIALLKEALGSVHYFTASGRQFAGKLECHCHEPPAKPTGWHKGCSIFEKIDQDPADVEAGDAGEVAPKDGAQGKTGAEQGATGAPSAPPAPAAQVAPADQPCAALGGVCMENAVVTCASRNVVQFKCGGGSGRRCCLPRAENQSPQGKLSAGDGNEQEQGQQPPPEDPTANPFSDMNSEQSDVQPGEIQYDRATGCGRGPQPGATRLLRDLKTQYPDVDTSGGRAGIFNCRTVRGGTATSLHSEGRAVDFPFNANDPADKARGDAAAASMVAQARSRNIQEVIWNRRIWKSVNPSWTAYGGSNAHTDHIHVGLNRQGAKQQEDTNTNTNTNAAVV